MKELQSQILKSSIKVFSKRGFRATFEEIAKDAKIKQPHIFYYYKNKKLLIQAMVQHILETNHSITQGEVSEGKTAKEKLIKHCFSNFLWANQHQAQAQIILLLYYMSVTDKNFRNIYNAISAEGRKRVHVYILEGVEKQEWSEELINVKSALIYNFLTTEVIHHLATDLSTSEKKFKSDLKKIIDITLRA